MIVNSYAKINIGLHILDKREDNFHNIITIFQEIDFYDQISIEKSDDFLFQSNVNWLDNTNNTCVKAFEIIKEKFPHISNVKIFLKKKYSHKRWFGRRVKQRHRCFKNIK